jgi:hypothetical protein
MVQRLEVRKLTERSRNTNRNKRSSSNKGGGAYRTSHESKDDKKRKREKCRVTRAKWNSSSPWIEGWEDGWREYRFPHYTSLPTGWGKTGGKDIKHLVSSLENLLPCDKAVRRCKLILLHDFYN